MDSLSKVLALGVWPALPLTGYWLFLKWNNLSKTSSLPWLASLALWMAMGIVAWSLLLLPAALFKIYRGDGIGAAGWVSVLLILFRVLKRPGTLSYPGPRLTRWDMILIFGLSIALYFYLAYPSECLFYHRDEAIYANHGMYIAKQGRLDVPYPWPSDLKDLLLNGIFLPPGLYKTQPTLTVQFGHLFSVWLAQASSSFGHQGAFGLNSFFTILSLSVFFGLCSLAMPRGYAVCATLFLAFNPSEIWLARMTLTEILTQLFIGSAFFALARALEEEDRSLAWVGGVLMGFSALIRIDAFLLVPLLLLSGAALRFLEGNKNQRSFPIWALFFKGSLPVFLLALAYYALFSRPYFFGLYRFLRMIGIFTAIASSVLFLSGVGSWNSRWKRMISMKCFLLLGGIGLLALTGYAYWIRPHLEPYSLIPFTLSSLQGARDYKENTLINLAQYLSPPVIFLGLSGWYLMLRKICLRKGNLPFFPMLICFAGFSLIYLWNPFVTPYHFWAIRRFVPIIIPGFIFFAAWFAWELLESASKRIPALKPCGSFLLIVFLSGFLVKADRLILTFAENQGYYSQFKTLTDRLPRDGLLLGYGNPSWMTALNLSFDRSVVPLNLRNEEGVFALYRAAACCLKQDRPIYILMDEAIHLTGLQAQEMDRMTFSVEHTEHTLSPLPREIVCRKHTLALYRITGMDPTIQESAKDNDPFLDMLSKNVFHVKLGNAPVLGVSESGFYMQEYEGGIPFRWTGRMASLNIPLSEKNPLRAISLEVGSMGGVQEKEVRILANDIEIFSGKIPDGGFEQILHLARVPMEKYLYLEIHSETHRPGKVLPDSPDQRSLGIALKGIRLLGEEPIFLNRTLGNRKVPGIGETGFREEESWNGMPFRWTDRRASLWLPMDPNRFPQFLSIDIGSTGGMKEKKVRILANGKELFDGAIQDGGTLREFSLAGVPPSGILNIEVLSDVHQPVRVIRGSQDDRYLGVMVRGIVLKYRIPDLLGTTIGSEKRIGIDESGFHGQESWDGRPFRWTGPVSSLQIPLRRGEKPGAMRVDIGPTGGIQEKRVKILANGIKLYDGKVEAGGMTRVLSLVRVPMKDVLTIEIRSESHIPKRTLRGSKDERALGILLKGIVLLDKP